MSGVVSPNDITLILTTYAAVLFRILADLLKSKKESTAMAPRSQLEIHTASLQRLTKEEATYHKEIEQQTERLQRLEAANGVNDEDGNKEYILKQEVSRSTTWSSGRATLTLDGKL